MGDEQYYNEIDDKIDSIILDYKKMIRSNKRWILFSYVFVGILILYLLKSLVNFETVNSILYTAGMAIHMFNAKTFKRRNKLYEANIVELETSKTILEQALELLPNIGAN